MENNYSEKEVPFDSNLLIIGGSGRNVGKTSLALILFEKYKHFKMLGLKVSSHRKNEENYHGAHTFYPADNYKIIQEQGIQPWKDTARMVNAGASSAYYIEAASDMISFAYNDFNQKYNPNHFPVICESRSLRKHIKPGAFILLIDTMDKISNDDINSADLIYRYKDGLDNLANLATQIRLNENGWFIDH
ncbi:MAG TPA: hypothetical protein VK212_08730 [Lentimicrobium sp.]|nr:hypothetical protein [Lentimicrobium sp.]